MYFSVLDASWQPSSPTAYRPHLHVAAAPAHCRRALDGELYFYGRALGFQPPMPADFEPIDIANVAS